MSSSFAPWQRRHLHSHATPSRTSLRVPSPLQTLHFLGFTSFFTAPEFFAYSASMRLRRSDEDAVDHHSSLVSSFLPSGCGWFWLPRFRLVVVRPMPPLKPKPPLLPPLFFPLFVLGCVLASVSRPPSCPPFTIQEPSPLLTVLGFISRFPQAAWISSGVDFIRLARSATTSSSIFAACWR